MDTVADTETIEALKVELKICIEEGWIDNPADFVTGAISALSIMGIVLDPTDILFEFLYKGFQE
tara:strand:+ start:321 stop:512 length:192 start_codon:yes stop_codon:yes gene_type:complete